MNSNSTRVLVITYIKYLPVQVISVAGGPPLLSFCELVMSHAAT